MWMSGGVDSRRGSQPTPARLKAQWRQTEKENREAIDVRKQWMRLSGWSEEEIETACECCFDLSLADELEDLAAAIRMQ
jgi:hypothetical protein